MEEHLLSCYLIGYEVINITAPKITPRDRERIKKTITRLIGTEIVEEASDRVVVQCFLKASAFSPDKIMRRQCALSLILFKDALHAFLERDIALSESLLERDEEVDRLYFLLVRLLRAILVNPRLGEKLEFSPLDCLDHRMIVSLVENIADQAVELVKLTLKFRGVATPKSLIALFQSAGEEIKAAYEEVIKALFSRDEKTLWLASRKTREAKAQLERLDRKVHEDAGTAAPLLSALPILKRILDYLTDMIDLITPTRWSSQALAQSVTKHRGRAFPLKLKHPPEKAAVELEA